MSAKNTQSLAVINLETAIWEVEAVLKLIGEAYQKVVETDHNEGSAAAGIQQMRLGVIERLNIAADALVLAHHENTAGKVGKLKT